MVAGRMIFFLRVVALICVLSCGCCGSTYAFDNIGIPVGSGSDDPDYELCPQGTRNVKSFLEAWKNDDQNAMYDLLDKSVKEGYSRQQAVFDFRMLLYRPYEISSIKQNGENFEYVLSYGSWEEGNKELRKMIVNGKTGGILMPTRNSPFKRSAEDYF